MAHPHDMAAFTRVVDRGSFAAAAGDLGLSPSAVSKIITRLEGRLGAQLITRTTRRLALTVEGETYLARCRDILAAIEQADSEVAYLGGRLRGHIRVAAGTALGRQYLVELIPAFLAKHPDLEIELDITDRRIDIVGENVDVALRAGQLADSSLVSRKIADARRVICASGDYLAEAGTPRDPAELHRHNCIRLSGFSDLHRWAFHGPDGLVHIDVTGNITTDSADIMLDLAIGGHGIIRVADVQAAQAVRRGDLVPLLADVHVSEPFPIWALTPKGRNRLPRVRVFLDFLLERLGRAPWDITANQSLETSRSAT